MEALVSAAAEVSGGFAAAAVERATTASNTQQASAIQRVPAPATAPEPPARGGNDADLVESHENDSSDEETAMLERAFHRWPLPHLRRQLLETRTALTRCQQRVVASARAAGTAQEDLFQLRRKHEAMQASVGPPARARVGGGDGGDARATVEEQLAAAHRDAARERELRAAADARRDEHGARVAELEGCWRRRATRRRWRSRRRCGPAAGGGAVGAARGRARARRDERHPRGQRPAHARRARALPPPAGTLEGELSERAGRATTRFGTLARLVGEVQTELLAHQQEQQRRPRHPSTTAARRPTRCRASRGSCTASRRR